MNQSISDNPFEIAGNCITDVAKLSFDIIKQIADSHPKGKEGGFGQVDITILSMIRHSAELLDAIGILVEKRALIPASSFVRAHFECLVSTRYMLKEDTVRRALSYSYFIYQRELSDMRLFDEESKEYEQFKKIKDKDLLIPSMKVNHEVYREQIKTCKGNMEANIYAEIREEVKRQKDLRKQRRKRRNNANLEKSQSSTKEIASTENNSEQLSGSSLKWYSLFDGPDSIQIMSYDLELGLSYERFYRDYSRFIHGNNNIQIQRTGASIRNIRIIPLRESGDIKEIGYLTLRAGWFIISDVLKYFDNMNFSQNNAKFGEIKRKFEQLF